MKQILVLFLLFAFTLPAAAQEPFATPMPGETPNTVVFDGFAIEIPVDWRIWSHQDFQSDEMAAIGLQAVTCPGTTDCAERVPLSDELRFVAQNPANLGEVTELLMVRVVYNQPYTPEQAVTAMRMALDGTFVSHGRDAALGHGSFAIKHDGQVVGEAYLTVAVYSFPNDVLVAVYHKTPFEDTLRGYAITSALRLGTEYNDSRVLDTFVPAPKEAEPVPTPQGNEA